MVPNLRHLLLILLCVICVIQGFAQNGSRPLGDPKVQQEHRFIQAIEAANLAASKNLQKTAQRYALQAESVLSTYPGNRDTWAELAYTFALVNLPSKAKIYQTKATSKTRGNVAIWRLPSLEKLGKSYILLGDKKGLNAVFEKAVTDAPTADKPRYKIAYVNGLFGIDDYVKASSILTELYSDEPLSNAERANLLSLLIINSLKLNQYHQIDNYYKELRELNASPTPNIQLAWGMYFAFKGKLNDAKLNLSKLAANFNVGKRDYADVEGTLQLANLYSRAFKKDSADFYFSKLASALKKPLSTTAAGNNFLKIFRAHQLRFNNKNAVMLDRSRDSAFEKELIAATKELAYKHKIEQDKQKAELLKKQRALEALAYDKKKQGFMLIIAALGLLIISSCAIIYILYQRRKQGKLLHLAEMERMKQWHKTEVVKKLSASQEAERWRIADQLHDEVGSMISVVRLNLSEHPLKKEPISSEKLATANRLLADVADTVREMSHQLMPVAIRQYGLINAIEQLINDINTSGKIYIEHLIYGFDNLSKYPEDFQVSFYRIVQELFQNIVKHAKATNAIFQLIEHPDSINLYIEDNGKGMEAPNNDKSGKGIGLLTNRIDYFEGKISIEGEPGKGTLIVIDIPTSNMLNNASQEGITALHP